MNQKWRSLKLRDVCTLFNGRAYSKSELLTAGKYRVLRVGNFFTNDHWYYSDLELDAEKYCDNEDLLYAWSASFGPRIWTGGKVIFHYHIWKVVPQTSIVNQRFLFYFLMWDTELIKKEQGTGTTMLHVAKGSMEDRDIQLPPLHDQQRIVEIIDATFDEIATAKISVENNLLNVSAMFESRLESFFAQPGDDWGQTLFGDIAVFRNGINFTNSSQGESVKIVGVRNFRNKFWTSHDNLESVIADRELPENDLLREHDVLFVRSNGNPELIGRCLLVGPIHNRIAHSGFTIRARLTSDKANPRYLCHFLKSPKTRRAMVNAGTGTNIKSLSQGTLSGLLVPLPPMRKQLQIAECLESLSDETQRLASIYRRKLAALDELKLSLLHQAFTGAL